MEKYISEMMGTLVLVALNNGVVANLLLKKTKADGEKWMLITFAAGMAVTMGIYVSMFRSGAHINPAVSIAFFMFGKLSLIDLLGYISFQLIGGIIGAFIVYLVYKKHYDISTNKDDVLATFSTGPAIDAKKWNLLTEILATMFLMFGVAVITSDSVNLSINLIPIVIGLLVMLLGVSFGGSTGFAMNPARDLGPRITHSLLRLGNSNWKYAIIPVLGPILGGIIGASVAYLYLGGF